MVGTVGDAGLRSPDELVAVIGLDPATLETLGASPITGFDAHATIARHPADRDPDDRAGSHRRARAGGGLRLDRDAAVRRATRAAAGGASAGRRHGGAGDIRLAAVEALFVTIIGVVAGIGLFLLTRPLVAKIPLDNATWFPAFDRAAAPAGASPCCSRSRSSASGAAVVALRRVVVTPLGVHRRQTPGMPGVAAGDPARGSRSRCCRSPSGCCAASSATNRARARARGRRVRRRHRRDRAGRSVADVPRRPGAPCAAGRSIDAARVAAADRRPAGVVRGDRRGDHGGLRRERVLLVRGVREGAGVRPGRRPRRGPGLRRDAVQRGAAVRRGPRPDRGRAGRPFRAADRDGRAHGGRPARPPGSCRASTSRRQFGLPVGGVRRRLGQGALGRRRHAARARLVHDHPGPGRATADHADGRSRGHRPVADPGLPRQPHAAADHRAGRADGSEGAVADQVLRHDRWVRGDRRTASDHGPRRSSPPRMCASPRRADRPRVCSRSSGGSSGWA